MSQRHLTISGRFLMTDNSHDHGTWTVHDHATGKRLSTSIRTVGELAELVGEVSDDQESAGQ